MTRFLGPLLAVMALGGCDNETGSGTCTPDPTVADCNPNFDPTWSQIYSRVIEKGCAVNGGSCHSADGQRGGLDLSDEHHAYTMLKSRGRVVPYDPACSTMVWRLEGREAGLMPPGDKLDDGSICAIKKWIQNGASR